MIILGIDPGLNKIGYGAIETENGLRVIKTGVICPPPHFTYKMKLENISRNFEELIENLKPDVVAIEEIYLGKNVQIALKIGQVMGIIEGLTLNKKIKFSLISPREIKKSLTGRGGATKEQVKFMVENLTGYRKFKKIDESDAVAVAISYLNTEGKDDWIYKR